MTRLAIAMTLMLAAVAAPASVWADVYHGTACRGGTVGDQMWLSSDAAGVRLSSNAPLSGANVWCPIVRSPSAGNTMTVTVFVYDASSENSFVCNLWSDTDTTTRASPGVTTGRTSRSFVGWTTLVFAPPTPSARAFSLECILREAGDRVGRYIYNE